MSRVFMPSIVTRTTGSEIMPGTQGCTSQLQRYMPARGRASMRFLAAWRIEDNEQLWKNIEGQIAHDHNGKDVEDIHMRAASAALWADYGMQSVTMPHTYAAALMATDVSHETMRANHPPWGAFEVLVPEGLVKTRMYGSLEAVYFALNHASAGIQHHYSAAFEHGVLNMHFATMPSLAGDSIHCSGDWGDVDKSEQAEVERALFMGRRLLVNVILDIATTPPTARNNGGAMYRPKRDQRGVCIPTTYTIGRPLSIDCRQDIRDYIAGIRRNDPKVTTLVRGHWRRQTHGPANSLRRLQWIQPFYRGEGPMLVRTTRLGYSAQEASVYEGTAP